MSKSLAVALSLAAAGCAQAPEAVAISDLSLPGSARIYLPEPGATLSGASQAEPADIVGGFLRSEATLVGARSSSSGGIRHVTFEQQVDGLTVMHAYAKASLDAQGRLVHVIDNLAPSGSRALAAPSIDEAAALSVALVAVHGDAVPASEVSRLGNVVTFAAGSRFFQAPTVERVAVPSGAGFAVAFLVETWTAKSNQLHLTLVSGEGQVLEVESRTNTDRYNVFIESPAAGAQTVVSGPGAGNAQSPAGWLGTGAQRTINASGNNVNAYLDRDANNAADPGGTAVTNGDFLAAADLSVSPTSAGNQAVAVQNLFFHNNRIHDVLYAAGFDEAAGNFQNNNFGKGGARGADAVQAEAQDGSGTDNANFSTPRDGQPGRMQMYLWTGVGTHQVLVGNASYKGSGAEFGPAMNTTGVSGSLVLAVDGTGAANDGCEALTNAAQVSGKIAVVDRGTCAFTVKAKNAQLAGATAVVVANNQGGTSIFTMGGTDTTITISSVLISQNDGAALKASLPASGTVRLNPVTPLQLDGDVDTDIVYHEYGHGLTWRMIGRMSGAMSGAIGEGTSDVLALVMNEDDAIGEYSASDARGIRSSPYGSYTKTYGQLTWAEVHDDGELYGAIGWRLLQGYGAANKTALLRDLVDGMNYTPAGPTYEQMRDGILSSISARGSTRACTVWNAFASAGVGVGATASVKGSSVTVTESFAKPAGCP